MLEATVLALPLALLLEIRSSMAKAPWINRFSEPRGRPCPWRWSWSCECRWLKLHRSINARSHDPGIAPGAGPGAAIVDDGNESCIASLLWRLVRNLLKCRGSSENILSGRIRSSRTWRAVPDLPRVLTGNTRSTHDQAKCDSDSY